MTCRRIAAAAALVLAHVHVPPAGAVSLRAWCREHAERLPHAAVSRHWLGPRGPMVACCESRGRADARNPRSSAIGLHQIMWSTWATTLRRAGIASTSVDLTDPTTNGAAAALVLDRQGWRAWAASRGCWA